MVKSFIVELWARIFGFLNWLTPFQLLRVCFSRMKDPGFVEVWVLANLGAAVFLLTLPDVPGWSCWETLLVAYAAIRTFEIAIYQSNVLLFDAYRKRKAGERYQVRGLRRLVLLLLHNYAELILWFGIIFRHLSVDIEPVADSWWKAFSMSFTTISGFGATSTQSVTALGEVTLQIEAVIGFVMALLILARFISLIPEPETADEFEKNK